MKQPIPFGKYYLLERVNVGGMAEVFKAKATGVEGFERLVAVKRILPSIAEDDEFITMFIDEAKIAVQLTHANIAQIFDLGKVDDSFFIALEYVHGRDLRAIFNRARQRNEPLPIQLVCYVIMKVCEGLDYAHQKRDGSGQFLNLVHRDVSPQNILVSHEGEVKVIDFGIAKAAGKAGKTQAGILKGKFGYMSPEQVQGMEIDRRSDIFGLGICLYELLTGERLFVAESDFATLEKVRNVDIMPPSTYNRRISEELEQIVLKALARDRSQRHQTAMELHDELQAYLYSSGNFFSRKDLSAYMHRVFADEIEKEIARDREYADMEIVEEELTGLHAFEELEPVSTVSELSQQPPAGPRPVALNRPAPKSTLLGMAPARAASVPPMTPRAASIPPPAPQAPGGRPGLDMDWDEEELSTQIYDKPEELSDAALQVMAAQASAPQLAPAPMTPTSMPPTSMPVSNPASAPLGNPSPFVGAAAPRADATDLLRQQQAAAAGTAAVPAPAAPVSRAPGGQRPWVLAVVVVAAVLLAVVAGVALLGRSSPGSIQLRTVPVDAIVTLDGQPVQGAASPWLITDVEPEVTHLIEVTKPGFQAWSSRVELQSDQTIALPEISLEMIESGFALGSAPSGARVFVDGAVLADVTPVRKTDLVPGAHTLRVEKEGYAPWETPVQITEGTVLELPVAVLRAMPPTEPKQEEEAPPPQRTRQARRPSPAPRQVRRATPRRATPRPAPAPRPQPAATGTGTLRINTRPWSNVFVDGARIGNTPQMNIELSSGRHTVTLVNDDFGIRKTIKITIKPDEVVTRVLNLSPE